jgi:hypothetical protein
VLNRLVTTSKNSSWSRLRSTGAWCGMPWNSTGASDAVRIEGARHGSRHTSSRRTAIESEPGGRKKDFPDAKRLVNRLVGQEFAALPDCDAA